MRTAASATTNARKISAKCGNGGAAANWFSGKRANARPARRAGPIVRLPQFARRGPTKEAHRRALNQPDGLLRSEAGQGHARFLRVTLPRGASDQRKRAEASDHRSPTPMGTHQGRGWGTHQGRDQGGDHSRTGQAPEASLGFHGGVGGGREGGGRVV